MTGGTFRIKRCRQFINCFTRCRIFDHKWTSSNVPCSVHLRTAGTWRSGLTRPPPPSLGRVSRAMRIKKHLSRLACLPSLPCPALPDARPPCLSLFHSVLIASRALGDGGALTRVKDRVLASGHLIKQTKKYPSLIGDSSKRLGRIHVACSSDEISLYKSRQMIANSHFVQLEHMQPVLYRLLPACLTDLF